MQFAFISGYESELVKVLFLKRSIELEYCSGKIAHYKGILNTAIRVYTEEMSCLGRAMLWVA